MSFRQKPQRANSFSLSSPIASSINKVLTLTRHSSSNDITGDSSSETRSDIVTHNFSFRRKASKAYSRVRNTVTSSAPSSRSKTAQQPFNKPLSKPTNNIEGVIVYTSANNGFSCNLVFTPTSLQFERLYPKSLDSTAKVSSSDIIEQSIPDVPRRTKLKNRLKYAEDSDVIYLLNIDSVEIQRTPLKAIIHFKMRNFKMLKVQIKYSQTKYDLDRVCKFFEDVCEYNHWRERGRPMILEKDALNSKSCLWEFLYSHYPFVKLTDFSDFDWAERKRLVNFVEFTGSDLSQTLPLLIPVLPGIEQYKLEKVGHNSADKRIPIVCYVYPDTGKVLIRSTTFKLIDEIEFVRQATSKSIFITESVSKHLDIYDCYLKLRKCTFNAVKYSQDMKTLNSALYKIDKSKKFWSKCNGWLAAISRALKCSEDISHDLRANHSVAIFEPFDSEWNCVISSLVQIMLEPKCRTIEGFERLISKEWLYFPGFKRNVSGKQPAAKYIVRVPSSVLFNLFLDAMHQLITQNPKAFQFSSTYLILLWDSCFQAQSSEKDFDGDFTMTKSHPEMNNVLYSEKCDCRLNVDSHITSIRLFNALYFRQVRIDNFHYSVPEWLQREALKKTHLM